MEAQARLRKTVLIWVSHTGNRENEYDLGEQAAQYAIEKGFSPFVPQMVYPHEQMLDLVRPWLMFTRIVWIVSADYAVHGSSEVEQAIMLSNADIRRVNMHGSRFTFW